MLKIQAVLGMCTQFCAGVISLIFILDHISVWRNTSAKIMLLYSLFTIFQFGIISTATGFIENFYGSNLTLLTLFQYLWFNQE